MKYIVLCKNNNHEVKDLSRRTAIRHKCLDCSGWNPGDVRECELEECPLYPYRMMNKVEGIFSSKDRADAIIKYCTECSGGSPYERKKCHVKDCSLFPYRMQRIDRSVEVKEMDQMASRGLYTHAKNLSYRRVCSVYPKFRVSEQGGFTYPFMEPFNSAVLFNALHGQSSLAGVDVSLTIP